MSKTLNLGEFVPVEIAQKLKEKGYPLLRVIKQNGNPIVYDLPQNHPNWQNCNAYYIPTISQVLKWLREDKNIHIEIYTNASGYNYIVSDTPKLGGSDKYWSDYEGPNDSGCWDFYEQAAIAGIEYVLDNLI